MRLAAASRWPQAKIVLGPALGCVLLIALCAATGSHLWHLWEHQREQYTHLARLELALDEAKNQKQERQAELARRFDPQQIQPQLRERYGWVDPRDLIVRLKLPNH